MTLVPSFQVLLQPFFQQMTAPTFASLLTLLAGWILARRHTVTGALLAAQTPGRKHHSAYHRVFAAARWSLDAVGLGLAKLILDLAADQGVICLVLDDTLCRHSGRRMFGVGMHYDPLLTGRKLSNANRSLKSSGHCWVILGLVLAFPFRPGHYFCLPILFRLCLNRKSAARHGQGYRSRPELGRELVRLICQHWTQHRFHLLVDSAYGGQETLKALPENCDLTARWILNATLHQSAAPKPKDRKGPQPKRGPRLPNPQQMLQDRCERMEMDVYGQHQSYRLNSVLACLRTVPDRLLRIVAAEPLSPSGKPRPQQRAAYYCTVLEASAEQVLIGYARRWSIEVAIHEAKGQLGFEQPQGWSQRAVERLAPTLMLLYSLVVLWFATEGHRRWRPTARPWYPQKSAASFADMLGSLRASLLRQRLRRYLKTPQPIEGIRKALRIAVHLVKQAA